MRIKIPLWAWVLVGFLLILAGTNIHSYHKGKKGVQKSWDASIERGKTLVEELKGKRAVITVAADIQYVERVKVIREKADTIVKYVNVYVPADTPDLSGGFRVLHDAASSNTLPDPSSIFNAAPVSAQTVAATVVENYGTCYATAFQLASLQAWVSKQALVVAQ